ncbi:MAG TPA: CoA-binding protein [Spirochaetota bacterium]|nr:CoA-binding protein [Spirochaetota bacterium]HPI90375.1 CoA-binding protein [Spirochaetota bacterium]HPR47527.1 CoA-binding protein [Spirochaetota bacterium]
MDKAISCEMPDRNPLEDEVKALLLKAKIIAVVGLSDRPERESYQVAQYLKEKGYTVIPVNPGKDEILGEKCYADLASIPVKVDIVDIFRTIEAVPGVVDEAISIGAGAVWMQLGLAHGESARRARSAGLEVVQSKCIKVEHAKMFN